jgi:hypothetical protein
MKKEGTLLLLKRGRDNAGTSSLYDVSLSVTEAAYINYDNSLIRLGVKILAGHSTIGKKITNVVVPLKTHGAPTGNATVGIRKAGDSSLVTLGTFALQQFDPDVDHSISIRMITPMSLLLTIL